MTANEFKTEARRLRPLLVMTARRYLGHADAVEDVVQDVLLRLWQMRGQLRLPADALAHVLTRNLSVSLLRRQHPREPIDLLDGAAPPETDERLERMMQVVERLPDFQQTILRLRHMEGMEMSDIAALMGTNEVALRKALSRARQTVRDKYQQMHDNE